MTRPLTGKPPQRGERTFRIGCLDCETIGLDGKITFVTWCHEDIDDGAAYCGHTMTDFLNHILNDINLELLAKTIWFSHNGEYDWRYLINALGAYIEKAQAPFKIMAFERAHGVLYQLEIKCVGAEGDRITRFRDSLAIYPRKLRDFTDAFSPDEAKGHIDFDKLTFDRSNPEHVEYARQDVRSLMRALQTLDEFIHERFQIHMSATASGIAYNAFLRTLPPKPPYWRLRNRCEDFVRETYVGGMVQLNAYYGQTYHDVHCYDVNSSYPASMKLGVPIGEPCRTVSYQEGLPGFYRIRFHVDRDFTMPVIAHKDNKGLSFPTCVGDQFIETSCTSIEIDYARSLGYAIDVIEGYYFEELGFVFNDYIRKCEALRAAFRGCPTEFVIKQMQNSLYGRFGMRPEGRQLEVRYSEPDVDELRNWGKVIDEETGDVIPHLYFYEEIRDVEYMLPHWASWITAQSRILLDTGARAVGIDRVLYRDTDSLLMLGEAGRSLDLGSAYGQWKPEYVADEARFLGPKMYGTIANGELMVKCKGIRKKDLRDPELRRKIYDGEHPQISYPSSTSFQTFIKTGKLSQERVRTPTRPQNIYSHILEGGKFKARRI